MSKLCSAGQCTSYQKKLLWDSGYWSDWNDYHKKHYTQVRHNTLIVYWREHIQCFRRKVLYPWIALSVCTLIVVRVHYRFWQIVNLARPIDALCAMTVVKLFIYSQLINACRWCLPYAKRLPTLLKMFYPASKLALISKSVTYYTVVLTSKSKFKKEYML